MSNVLNVKGEIDNARSALDNVIDVTNQSDTLNSSIRNYYNAIESNDSDKITDSQKKIIETLFEYGDYISGPYGGFFWDTYKDVFDKTMEIGDRESEKGKIKKLCDEAATSNDMIAYEYYGEIFDNFDEYYKRKIALKEALNASESKTAIQMFYESYQENNDYDEIADNIYEGLDSFMSNTSEKFGLEDETTPIGSAMKKMSDAMFNGIEYCKDGVDAIINGVKQFGENWLSGIEIIYDTITNGIVRKTKTKTNTARTTHYDPLILDLDGDGFNVEKKELGTNFDLDKNGFEALAQYDGNGDGVIDANDEIFDSLRVWVDADGNGISGEGEMKTLAELGITSINLGYENVNAATGTEATIGNTATFTREDGTTGSIGELWVSSDLFDTVDRLDIEISDEIAALPDVKSIGNVYSLRNAMALDGFVNIA